ncbi:protein phosphatase 1E [Elysia marginata]|uniref:Protein phosphatase 1E n=1 Tax=Elysia marginata TaxID=1093978 RepID=A0AAV4G2B5_9GAST|nr:protein phosphatase 1E [Elysia marginata]
MDDEEATIVYRQWLEQFGNKIDSLSPEEYETPFRLTSSILIPLEFEGECLEWSRRYLSLHDCPNGLIYQLSRAVYKSIKGSTNISRFIIDSGEDCCREDEDEDGSDNISHDSYDDLDAGSASPQELSASKLLREVVSHVHDVIKEWNRSPPPLVSPPISLHVCSHAIKNTRRKMEDRHVAITDLNTLYDLKDGPSQSYFAVFDGHGGIEAADYAAAHLHNYLLQDPHFTSDPAAALKQAYKTTDAKFLEKAKRQGLRSGTTGVSALVRGEELHLAWLGDSQALLVRAGQPIQIMDPHKPEREDERRRIEELGGCVLFFGAWRVNGNIAVARAIGDAAHKPFISSDADVTSLHMTGEEEYLVLACDGLWDVLSPAQVINTVYKHSHTSPGGLDDVAIGLVNAARDSGSSDNISVVVVLFKSKLSVPQATSDSGILLGMGGFSENTQDNFPSTSSSSSSVPQPRPPALNRKLDGRSKGDTPRDNVFDNEGSIDALSSAIQQTPFSHKLMRQVNFYMSSHKPAKRAQDPNLAQLALKQAVSSAGKERLSRKHKHYTTGASELTGTGGNLSSFAKKSPRRETRKPKARSLTRQPIFPKGSNVNHSKKKKNHGNNVTSFSLSLAGGGSGIGGETLWGYSDDSDDAWSVSTGLSEDWPQSKHFSTSAAFHKLDHPGNLSKAGEQLLTPLRLKGSSLLQAAISVEASTAAAASPPAWSKNMSSVPFLQLSGTTLQLTNRATLPQILPSVPPTPPRNTNGSTSRSGSLQFSQHSQLAVVPPLWGPSRRLSSLCENDVRSMYGDSMPPPSLGGRKLSVLSDTGLSRKRQQRSSQAKESSQGLETSRRPRQGH